VNARPLKKLLSVRQYPLYARLVWWRNVTPMLMKRKGVQFGDGVVYFGSPIISSANASRIIIGERCVLCSVSAFTALGVRHPVVLRTVRPEAVIQIGSDTGMSGASICAAISIKIGSRVLLGANVTIVDTDFHALDPYVEGGRMHNNDPKKVAAAPVIVEDNVFVGANSIILKGVTIGENSVIGAGSVVTRSIPANVIAAGNPARVLRQLCTGVQT
jgi:acetyltransferase-like isoleucine patch superfamily enzyme